MNTRAAQLIAEAITISNQPKVIERLTEAMAALNTPQMGIVVDGVCGTDRFSNDPRESQYGSTNNTQDR